MDKDRMDELVSQLHALAPDQVHLVAQLVEHLARPVEVEVLDPDGMLGQEFTAAFGAVLQMHHCLSNQPFTKDKFEWAMVDVLTRCGFDAVHGPPGLAGHDIQVANEKWSLKTQADRSIKLDALHISKFMEMGKGKWTDEKSLSGLRDRFLKHMKGYDRIFSLRHFVTESGTETGHLYELVEIPKTLLEESLHGTLEMRHKSRQNPKPGYCTVRDAHGDIKFQLYFDGGTERKLQIKALRKCFCMVHCSWNLAT